MTPITQKRPDVHKIVLSMKSRSPPLPEKVSIFRILYWFVQFFLILAPFRGGRRVNQILRTRISWTPGLFWITHKHNFATHPVPGQSRKFVYVYALFSCPETGMSSQKPQAIPGSTYKLEIAHLDSDPKSHCAAKGGTQKGIGRSFFFGFGHLLVTILSPFLTFLVTFLPIPFF